MTWKWSLVISDNASALIIVTASHHSLPAHLDNCRSTTTSSYQSRPLHPRRFAMAPPVVTLTAPHSPTRARSVSQPIREDVATDFTYPSHTHEPRQSILRSQSSNSVLRATAAAAASAKNGDQGSMSRAKGRARSSSLVTVTEVGGDEPENVVDRLGVGSNENAAWVNAPGMLSGVVQADSAGAWAIHIVLILLAKVLIDAIPGMTQDVSWTIVNLGYMAVSRASRRACWRAWLTCRRRSLCSTMSRVCLSSRRELGRGLGECSDL